jgi:hypothetical protein
MAEFASIKCPHQRWMAWADEIVVRPQREEEREGFSGVELSVYIFLFLL